MYGYYPDQLSYYYNDISNNTYRYNRYVRARQRAQWYTHVSLRATCVLLIVITLIVSILACAGRAQADGVNIGDGYATYTITVQAGDTLWSICEANPVEGMSTYNLVDKVQTLNGLESSDIYPGQNLKLLTQV